MKNLYYLNKKSYMKDITKLTQVHYMISTDGTVIHNNIWNKIALLISNSSQNINGEIINYEQFLIYYLPFREKYLTIKIKSVLLTPCP